MHRNATFPVLLITAGLLWFLHSTALLPNAHSLVAIGLAVRIVFASVELAGEMIGLQMGLNYAGFFDPSTVVLSDGTGSLPF